MKISRISLQHYRNIELARIEFDTDRPTFFVGSNGQGKSNMLEALGLVTAVRSFRTYELGPLIQSRRRMTRLLFELNDAGGKQSSVELQITSRTRSVIVDDVPVNRMADFVGQFPCVVFAADDTQLIKTSPQARRRFFDLLFSVVDPSYLSALQSYHRGLKERNQALKSKMNRAVVTAYDKMLARGGLALVQKRGQWVEVFSPLFESNYRRIVDGETGGIAHRSNLDVDSEGAFLDKLNQSFERDSALGTTMSGPHRDDYQFVIHSFGAKTHGSDGQQRSAVLALKLAQIDLIESVLKKKPIVLLDDILGELDEERKSRFWKIFDHGCQVFASGTSLPKSVENGEWDVFEVKNGQFSRTGSSLTSN